MGIGAPLSPLGALGGRDVWKCDLSADERWRAVRDQGLPERFDRPPLESSRARRGFQLALNSRANMSTVQKISAALLALLLIVGAAAWIHTAPPTARATKKS